MTMTFGVRVRIAYAVPLATMFASANAAYDDRVSHLGRTPHLNIDAALVVGGSVFGGWG